MADLCIIVKDVAELKLWKLAACGCHAVEIETPRATSEGRKMSATAPPLNPEIGTAPASFATEEAVCGSCSLSGTASPPNIIEEAHNFLELPRYT